MLQPGNIIKKFQIISTRFKGAQDLGMIRIHLDNYFNPQYARGFRVTRAKRSEEVVGREEQSENIKNLA